MTTFTRPQPCTLFINDVETGLLCRPCADMYLELSKPNGEDVWLNYAIVQWIAQSPQFCSDCGVLLNVLLDAEGIQATQAQINRGLHFPLQVGELISDSLERIE